MNNTDSLRLLDCTLRDGGFYNNWDFDEDTISSYLKAMNESGVHIVEIGYRSILSNDFFGLLKYSDERQLSFLQLFPNLEYSLMVDLKEFVRGGKFDAQLFATTFQKHANSRISWIRIAILHDLVDHCEFALKILKDQGYKTTVNLMQISLLSDEEIMRVSRTLNAFPVDVFYFADSFGGMLPQDVKRYITLIRQNYHGALGVHFHDNLGLAFANSLAAVETGVEFLDSTVLGMGRGAGNLKTELILLFLKVVHGNQQLNPNVLLEFISKSMEPCKQKFQWGPSFSYALSGFENIHPMYCQKLEELGRYTGDKVIRILQNIPREKKSKYSAAELEHAIVRAQEASVADADAQSFSPLDTFGPQEQVLVVGTGPSAKKYSKAIQEYVSTGEMFVIECNPASGITYQRGFGTLIHEKHLVGKKIEEIRVPVVFGSHKLFTSARTDAEKYFFRYRITPGCFDSTENQISIPSEVVSMYSLGLALLLQPKRLILVGFDGYEEYTQNAANYIKQQEMESFFALFQKTAKSLSVEFFSATPTSYTIPKSSIFYLLTQVAHEA